MPLIDCVDVQFREFLWRMMDVAASWTSVQLISLLFFEYMFSTRKMYTKDISAHVITSKLGWLKNVGAKLLEFLARTSKFDRQDHVSLIM